MRRDVATIAAWFAALSVAYWVGVFSLCGERGFPLDDSFIHLQFARNLYEDGQMAFNKGVPSSGSTAPLYPMLLVAFYCLVRDWHLASYLLGGACSLGTALAVYGILRSWTARQDLARWGGLLTVVTCPTLVQAYTGMESPVYSFLFLLGLWLYARPGRRLRASAAFALCIWLRPEFLMMLPLICLERAVAAYRAEHWRLATFVRDVWPHAVLWTAMVALYCGYHWHQDGHLVPSTFAAKAVAPRSGRPAWVDGLPAAIQRGDPWCILLAIFFWPTAGLFLTGAGLGVNCAPLAFGLREAIVALWRNRGPEAAAWRLAVISLVGYPYLRGFVDSLGFVLVFQFQRYCAHLTPLLIIVVLGALPATGVVVQRSFWDWRGLPLPIQQRRTLRWAAVYLLVIGPLAVMSVWNIDSMQVPLGRWVQENTAENALIATNDIGAIGYLSRRPILDTVGLIEPAIAEHYIRGGTLLEYLQQRNPAYVIIFPRWYQDLSTRDDMLEPVKTIELDLNVVCGAAKMVVYKPKWDSHHSAPP